MLAGMQKELGFYPNAQFQVLDAHNDRQRLAAATSTRATAPARRFAHHFSQLIGTAHRPSGGRL
jgi:hypothetical protein